MPHRSPQQAIEFIEADSNMQSMLIVQTASPAYIIQAIESIRQKNLLGPVRTSLFCRGKAEELSAFQKIDWIDEIIVHHEANGSIRHLLNLRRRRFDIVITFLSKNPSYWKIKVFSFLCGGRHLLIFNEHLGCFYYNHTQFYSLLQTRFHEWMLRRRQQIGYSLGTSQGHVSRPPSLVMKFIRPFHLGLKILVFPFRFVFLLIWCRRRENRRQQVLNSGTFLFSKEEMN